MSKWIDRANLPKEAGMYWARTSGRRYWNLLAIVSGDSPFFRVDVLDIMEDRYITNANIYDIEEFGERLPDAPEIEGKRQDWS